MGRSGIRECIDTRRDAAVILLNLLCLLGSLLELFLNIPTPNENTKLSVVKGASWELFNYARTAAYSLIQNFVMSVVMPREHQTWENHFFF